MLKVRARGAIKGLACRALYYSGALRLWRRYSFRRKAVVLMYHRVLTGDERLNTGSHPGIIVDAVTFERQMRLLKREFTILSLEEFVRRLEQGIPFPDASCLVTFDDGWHDNFTNALPVLEKLGIPAVVFLPVSYIGGRKVFAREALTHLLVEAGARVRRQAPESAEIRQALAAARLQWVLAAPAGNARTAVAEGLAEQRDLSGPSVDALVETLAGILSVDVQELPHADRFIGWSEVAAMAQRGVAFGGHGVQHHVLTRVPAETAATEISGSKVVIDTVPGAAPVFAYPGGGWNTDIADMVRRAGYRAAFTTDAGHVRCGDDRFALRRVNVHEDATSSNALFMARVVGLC